MVEPLLTRFAPERNLVLAGYMGAGKTTVGRILGREFQRRFIDLDEELAKRKEADIAELFARGDEQQFRQWERDLACELAQEKDLVLALGGGTLEDETAYRELAVFGFIVYLQAPFGTLWERITSQNSQRPLVKQLGKEGLQRLLEARSENYEQRSHLTVHTERLPPETVARVIRHAFYH